MSRKLKPALTLEGAARHVLVQEALDVYLDFLGRGSLRDVAARRHITVSRVNDLIRKGRGYAMARKAWPASCNWHEIPVHSCIGLEPRTINVFVNNDFRTIGEYAQLVEDGDIDRHWHSPNFGQKSFDRSIAYIEHLKCRSEEYISNPSLFQNELAFLSDQVISDINEFEQKQVQRRIKWELEFEESRRLTAIRCNEHERNLQENHYRDMCPPERGRLYSIVEGISGLLKSWVKSFKRKRH